MKNIQKALSEIQADLSPKEEITSSTKAYQTIKCESNKCILNAFSVELKETNVKQTEMFTNFHRLGMIALKRKLKRIRENKEH